MSKDVTDYMTDAKSDARDTVNHFLDEVIDMLVEKGEASDDLLNDYPHGDSYHHETHVEKSYDLIESAQILDQLYAYEETDSGLWQGLEPRRAIEVQAAYTYGGSVYFMFQDLIKELNEDTDIQEILAEEKDEDGTLKPENEGKLAAAIERVLQRF